MNKKIVKTLACQTVGVWRTSVKYLGSQFKPCCFKMVHGPTNYNILLCFGSSGLVLKKE